MSQPQLLRPGSPNPHAPLFVFLPGMDGSGGLLQQQVSDLALNFDVRSLSLSVNDLSSWEQLVEQVTALLTAAQNETEHQSHGPTALKTPAKRPIYLCGESFGACLALQVATYQPALVERLILINPASSFSHIPLFQWGSWASELLPQQLYQLSAIGLVPFLIAPERVVPTQRQALLQAMQAVSPKTAAWRLRLLRNFALNRLALETLVIPTLLVAGERDRLLPSRQEIQRIAQRLPEAQTRFLPRSGHACLLEADVNLSQILETADFLPPQSVASSTAFQP